MLEESVIESAIKSVVNTKHGYEIDHLDKFTIYVKTNQQNHLLVEVTCTYSSPDVSYEQIEEIAKQLNFSKFEKYAEISIEGCETCDYGSSYGYALRFWN
jgi:hypothetical protein